MHSARLALSWLIAARLALVPAGAQAAPKPVGAIVAVVDGEPVTLWQVRKRIEPTLRAQRASTRPWLWPESARTILREAVEREIDARLFAAAARSRGIVVDKSRIDAQLLRAASEYGRSIEQYLAELQAAGWSEARIREEVGRQILEWDVLFREWTETHDTPAPSGDQWLQWRKRWLAERRTAACIELRIPRTS